MSNSTATAAGAALPSGVTTSGDLSSSLSILLVGTVGSSFLIPISAVLLYFTSARTQRRPMFLMMLTSLVLGLGEGGLNMYNQIAAIRHTAVPTAVTTTYTFVHLFLPLITESILVFRVTAMHPPKRLSRFWKTVIYVPIALFKIARLVVLVAIAISWIANSQGLPAPVRGGLDALTQINKLPSQVRWALQVADTLFMSVMFFPRSKSKPVNHQKDARNATHHTRDTEEEVEQPSFWARFKTLFWAAVSSFVFPVLLNMIQFALVLVQDGAGVLQFPSLFAVNNQAGIVGMVFATVFTPHGHAKPAARRAAPTTARPGLNTQVSDGSFKEDKDEGESAMDSPGLPELLSDARPATHAHWTSLITSQLGGGMHGGHGDFGGLAGGLLGSSGRSSPTCGLGDVNGMFGSVAGAFSGGVDGALGHVGHSINLEHLGQNLHIGNVGQSLRHLAHGFRDSAGRAVRSEARSRVDDLEAGVITVERRAVDEVSGRAKSVVEGARDRVDEEVREVRVHAAGAVDGVQGQARDEVRDVEARVRDEEGRLEDIAKEEADATETRLRERERRVEDMMEAQVRVEETRVHEEVGKVEDTAEEVVRADEARAGDAEAEARAKLMTRLESLSPDVRL